jgi:hypothetical protein
MTDFMQYGTLPLDYGSMGASRKGSGSGGTSSNPVVTLPAIVQIEKLQNVYTTNKWSTAWQTTAFTKAREAADKAYQTASQELVQVRVVLDRVRRKVLVNVSELPPAVVTRYADLLLVGATTTTKYNSDGTATTTTTTGGGKGKGGKGTGGGKGTSGTTSGEQARLAAQAAAAAATAAGAAPADVQAAADAAAAGAAAGTSTEIIAGISNTTLLLLGGGAILAFVLLRRKGNKAAPVFKGT